VETQSTPTWVKSVNLLIFIYSIQRLFSIQVHFSSSPPLFFYPSLSLSRSLPPFLLLLLTLFASILFFFLSLSLYLSIYDCISVHIYLWLSLFLFLSLSLYMYLFISLFLIFSFLYFWFSPCLILYLSLFKISLLLLFASFSFSFSPTHSPILSLTYSLSLSLSLHKWVVWKKWLRETLNNSWDRFHFLIACSIQAISSKHVFPLTTFSFLQSFEQRADLNSRLKSKTQEMSALTTELLMLTLKEGLFFHYSIFYCNIKWQIWTCGFYN